MGVTEKFITSPALGRRCILEGSQQTGASGQEVQPAQAAPSAFKAQVGPKVTPKRKSL